MISVLAPGLAVRWQWLDNRTLEVTFSQGVKFHNGEVFDAAIVQLNWEDNTRLRQPHMPGTYLNFSHSRRRRMLLKINELSHSVFVNIKPIESITYAF